MVNHANRSKHAARRNPLPSDIQGARERAQLTQGQAAALVHTTDRVWRQWEAGDRQMHPAFWELFNLKVKRHLPSAPRVV